MNTPPSPEAKQAAEKIISHTGANHFDLVVTMDYVQQAIDAATAKLRDDIRKMTDDQKQLVDIWFEASAVLGTDRMPGGSIYPTGLVPAIKSLVEEAAKLREEQPSATGHECPFCGKLAAVLLNNHDFPRRQKVWVQCDECGARTAEFAYYAEDKKGSELAWAAWKRRPQPSATTPEVEKWTFNFVATMFETGFAEDTVALIVDAHNLALAQVRAPLMARIAQMEQWLADVGYSAKEIDKALESYRWVKPALTGTGEK